MTDSSTMSAHENSKSSSTRTTVLKGKGWTRLCMSASTLEIFGHQSERSVTWPLSSPKPCGARAIEGEQAAAIPKKEPEDTNHRQRQTACEILRGPLHYQTGGLRDPGILSSPGDQDNPWIEQEIHTQLSELGQIDPVQGVCERQRHDHQQAGEQHQELGIVGGSSAPGLPMA